MPVSPTSQAKESKAKRKRRSSTPHLCVLKALMPTRSDHPSTEWPILNRASLREACGFSPKNTMNRLINGDSSGKGGKGLVGSGLIETVSLDIEGVVEINYRITIAGIDEYRRLTSHA